MDARKPPQPVTRALLMDAGGLLFNNVTEETDFVAALARHHGADGGKLRQYLEQWDAAYETGAQSVHSVLEDCLAAAGARRVRLDRAWTDARYLDSVHAHAVAFDWLDWLRVSRPDLTLALANNEAEHWDRLKNGRDRHFRLFDVIGSSWHLGAVKPGRDYFDRLLLACGCAAEEAVLADDNSDVVRDARRLGVRAVHVPRPHMLPRAFAFLASPG